MDNATKEIIEALDLTGEVCPYTFVKTKLALEDLEPGALLCVFVDSQSASINVPKSAKREGHEVLSVIPEREGWSILLRCKP